MNYRLTPMRPSIAAIARVIVADVESHNTNRVSSSRRSRRLGHSVLKMKKNKFARVRDSSKHTFRRSASQCQNERPKQIRGTAKFFSFFRRFFVRFIVMAGWRLWGMIGAVLTAALAGWMSASPGPRMPPPPGRSVRYRVHLETCVDVKAW
jgi:hypothetical protein